MESHAYLISNSICPGFAAVEPVIIVNLEFAAAARITLMAPCVVLQMKPVIVREQSAVEMQDVLQWPTVFQCRPRRQVQTSVTLREYYYRLGFFFPLILHFIRVFTTVTTSMLADTDYTTPTVGGVSAGVLLGAACVCMRRCRKQHVQAQRANATLPQLSVPLMTK